MTRRANGVIMITSGVHHPLELQLSTGTLSLGDNFLLIHIISTELVLVMKPILQIPIGLQDSA